MNDWTASQIKELVKGEIEGERRLRDALRKEDHRWFERELKSLARALELQAKEYERRLQDLNHAHAQAQQVLATYLPREVYERANTAITEWQRKGDVINVEIEARIKALEAGTAPVPGSMRNLELGLAAKTGQQEGTNTARSTAITIVALVIAAISVLVGAVSYINR